MDKQLQEKRKKIICELLQDEIYIPMKEKEMAAFLQVSKEDREDFHELLDELLREGKIDITERGKYVKPGKNMLKGIFISNARGFGFVEIEGMETDLFIPEEYVNGAFHNDTVQVRLLEEKSGKRQEAEVIRILSRGTTQVVGTFQKGKNFGFVVPDNMKLATDIFIPIEWSKGAMDGHKVVVDLTSYGDERKSPEGKVTEILGHVNDPGVDILSIVKGFDIPMEFSEKVMKQANRIKLEVSEADMLGREDLRDMMMVTIDGEDAKDLDDAVSLSREGEDFLLGVHIADVTNYVQENSALDREALKRGTSVYLVDRVIPMLPHRLSNGICSLNEGVDRLALSCLMKVSPDGEVKDYRIVESVIRVDRRMTYTSVKKILEDKDQEERTKYEVFVPMFEEMEALSKILRAKRKKRGAIDFDFPETKIILDKEGKPLDIKPYERNTATKIIEDFMLLANETVAQHFYWLEIPFVYRTHDNPDPDKINQLGIFISNFGLGIKTAKEEVHPKEIQKLLGKVEGTPEEALISRLALRSMKQARYSIDCTGHFGLACSYYCHFTSPIRRYPDLQIHRIIKEHLRERLREERILHYAAILPQVADQSSKMERRAETAERETNKLKKTEYMEEHIGERFEGVVSGITGWGIYVELPNTVEGLIHVSDLEGDYFYYDEANYEMVGRDTGKKYKLGQRIAIIVAKTDQFNRTVDFVEDDMGDDGDEW
ncbi:MAG: ribonuclease R [Lachnospiraceae bacterium]|mgnify:FL=1|jgi:ribonuclease R|nr:ribonuclease R [Lachnospiraceae bacterium]MCI9109110.1 ribonuclease R [Lachnospiraceae bacterium]MCI9344185.1 ribonuclease R [Lachnospiraceae bacterium]